MNHESVGLGARPSKGGKGGKGSKGSRGGDDEKRGPGRPRSNKVTLSVAVAPECAEYVKAIPQGPRGEFVEEAVNALQNDKYPIAKAQYEELINLIQQHSELLNMESPLDESTKWELQSLAGKLVSKLKKCLP